MDPFDLAALDLQADGTTPGRARKTEMPSVKVRRDRQFLPALPERTFCRLVQLPRRAWAVYSVALFRSRLERSKVVVLTTCFLSRFGLTRWDKCRALPSLERAGLVRVVRRSNRQNPTVEILD
jgi:hypothetical protein